MTSATDLALNNHEEVDSAMGIAPIVIDLGKKRKRPIRDLKRGRGRLMAEVASVMSDVRARLGAVAEGKELVPVVLVYRKKDKKKRSRGLIPFRI